MKNKRGEMDDIIRWILWTAIIVAVLFSLKLIFDKLI